MKKETDSTILGSRVQPCDTSGIEQVAYSAIVEIIHMIVDKYNGSIM